MPGWSIELLAGEKLSRAFWIVLAVPVPFWLLMVFVPRLSWVRKVAHPFVAPLLMVIPLVYLYREAWLVGGVAWPGGVGYTEARDIVIHPLGFLILWCQVQALHLLLGTVVYQDALKRGMRIPLELLACWLLGPLGLLVYVLRLLILKLNKG